MIVVFFCIKREIAGVRTIIPHGIFAFILRSSMRRSHLSGDEIVLKCVMLSNAMIESLSNIHW